MSYTAPAGSAIAFAFDGAGYFAPAGSEIDFSFAPLSSFTVKGAGYISVAGDAGINHGTCVASSGNIVLGGGAVFPFLWEGVLQVGGKVVFVANSPLVARGPAALSGSTEIRLNSLLRLSGPLHLDGRVEANVGPSWRAQGVARLGGGAVLGSGRRLSCSGTLGPVFGAAAFRHGVTFFADGQIPVAGGAALGTASVSHFQCAGALQLAGAGFLMTSIEMAHPSLAILTRPTHLVVFTHGL